MKERFVKLKDLKGFDDEFLNALGELEQRVFESYNKFMPLKESGRPGPVPGEHPMFTEFKENFGYDTSGRKYLRLVTVAFGEGQTSVWGFVAKTDGVLKGIPYFVGDVFKAAGWRAPAKHVRGTIFSSKTNWFSWTGPNYLI